jgi:transposase-like protein
MQVMPKKVDPALKARAVRLVADHLPEYPSMTAACEAVAQQVGVGTESVRRWVVRAQVDSGQRAGVTTEEHEEIKKLKAKVRRLEEDNEILRRASIFFAGELDPRNR